MAPAVVIDNGTGYTKMGFAGNCEPSFIIPSVIGTKDAAKARKDWKGLEDMDFWIGDEATARAGEYTLSAYLHGTAIRGLLPVHIAAAGLHPPVLGPVGTERLVALRSEATTTEGQRGSGKIREGSSIECIARSAYE